VLIVNSFLKNHFYFPGCLLVAGAAHVAIFLFASKAISDPSELLPFVSIPQDFLKSLYLPFSIGTLVALGFSLLLDRKFSLGEQSTWGAGARIWSICLSGVLTFVVIARLISGTIGSISLIELLFRTVIFTGPFCFLLAFIYLPIRQLLLRIEFPFE
jgi:hypothetical protein